MKNYIDRQSVSANGGKAEMYVNGEKTVPLWLALSDIPGAKANTEYAQKNIAQFGKAGLNIVCTDCNLQSGWKKGLPYDASECIRETEAVVRANPNAQIIMRLHVNAPYWWLRENPDELIGYWGIESTDSGDYPDRLIAIDRNHTEMRASYASEKFHKEIGEIVTECCKQIKRSSVGEHLLGVQIAYGTCGEWHWWGKNYAEKGGVDYGKAMLKFFRKHLREKYKTVAALQKAYGTDETFENVRVATPSERLESVNGYRVSPRVIDSLFCMQRATTTAIIAFCKAVKAADENILAGAFYGYFFGAGDTHSGAQYDQQSLYNSPCLDFIGTTAPYSKNKRSGNFAMFRHIAESMRLNGLLVLNEMDQGYAGVSHYRGDGDGVWTCESEEEYACVLKRNMMEHILRGYGAWYYDHRLPTDSIYEKIGYWDKPCRMETIEKIQRASEKLLDKPFVKTTDVLLVFDTEEKLYKTDSFFNNTWDTCDFFDAVMKSGAAVDWVLLSDMEKVDFARYKCVMFVECITTSKKTCDFIRSKVCSDGRTVVFIDECGLIVDGVFDKQNHKDLVANGIYLPKPSIDKAFYHDLFKRAGAYIYSDGGELIVADNECVMMHCKDVAHSTLHLPCGDIEIENGKYNTVVYNIHTGERIL